jgi:hypothetical protein
VTPGTSAVGPEGTALAEEVEAWLNGELAAVLARSTGALPSWLVLNRLAHADPDVLVPLAGGVEPSERSPFERVPTWAAAEQGLARELVGDGDDPEAMAEVQRRLLVPLELRLIELASHRPVTLGQVVTSAAKALGERRSG